MERIFVNNLQLTRNGLVRGITLDLFIVRAVAQFEYGIEKGVRARNLRVVLRMHDTNINWWTEGFWNPVKTIVRKFLLYICTQQTMIVVNGTWLQRNTHSIIIYVVRQTTSGFLQGLRLMGELEHKWHIQWTNTATKIGGSDITFQLHSGYRWCYLYVFLSTLGGAGN